MTYADTTNSQQVLPATVKQLNYAKLLAERNHTVLPWEIQQDRRSLSRWIDAQSKTPPTAGSMAASSKQVALAERLARAKRRQVPDECFRSRELMTRWIDSVMR